MSARLTRITAQRPSRLSKAFWLEGDHLKAAPGGFLTRGRAEIQEVATLNELASLLASLTPAQALTYGIPRSGDAGIMTAKTYERAGRPAGWTARTNAEFAWPDGAGVMMLDYDPADGQAPLDRDRLLIEIVRAVPGLADAAWLWWPSASSCIWHGDAELQGIKGQRLWILVEDASDIPRAGKALVERLWLAGLGWVKVSKSGALLERALVDATVWTPEHLDFAGGAACGEGLVQRRGIPQRIGGGIEVTNTRAAIPDLTEAEQARVSELKEEAREARKPEAEALRSAWIDERVKEMLSGADASDPEVVKRARKAAERALERRLLGGDFVLWVEATDGAVTPVTVRELLDNRVTWDGRRCRDPIEPDYDGGRLVARLFLRQVSPQVHSFARGGASYRLQRAATTVQIIAGFTDRAVNATADVLRGDGLTYDFGDQLATVDDGTVYALNPDTAAYHLGGRVLFEKFDRRMGEWVTTDPPDKLVRQLLALGSRRRLKPLDAVVTAPVVRLDGSILDRPGYCRKTRLLLDPADPDGMASVPLTPSIDQARQALDRLLFPFELFPFVNETARGAMLAALLTAAARPVLPTSPAFAFDAPTQGSGKTLLALCVGALLEGRDPGTWSHAAGRDDEEVRKRLFTALLSGANAIVWDNVVGAFDSASMAAALTSPSMTDRILGKSESHQLPNRALILFTGNNFSLKGDMIRRVLVCRIDPGIEAPHKRSFDLDPLAYTLANRTEMLRDACILLRARFVYQTERAPGSLASFEAWDAMVRQTVVWADAVLRPGAFGDPVDLIDAGQADDPEREALGELLEALREKFGSSEFTAKQVKTAITDAAFGVSFERSDIELALIDLVGAHVAGGSARSLGIVLKNRQGLIARGLKLACRNDRRTNQNWYRVEEADAGRGGGSGPNFGRTRQAAS